RGIIRQLATQLSPPLRNAFRLRGLEDFSIQEAAQALGVTEGTLKAQYFRARARIRALVYKSKDSSRDDRSQGNVRRHESGCKEGDIPAPTLAPSTKMEECRTKPTPSVCSTNSAFTTNCANTKSIPKTSPRKPPPRRSALPPNRSSRPSLPAATATASQWL